jgi:hypothetical protein
MVNVFGQMNEGGSDQGVVPSVRVDHWVVEVVGIPQVGMHRRKLVGQREETIAVRVVSPPRIGRIFGSNADQLSLELHLSTSPQAFGCQFQLNLSHSCFVTGFSF